MALADKTLTCRDCGRAFTFTVGEQEFYASRGLTNEPSRCPECRAARRSDGGGGGGGGRSYGGGGGGGGGFDRAPRQMYPAVCAQCGKQTEVPFLPSGEKPVYCSDCFSARRSSGGGGGGGGDRRGDRSSRGGGGGGRW